MIQIQTIRRGHQRYASITDLKVPEWYCKVINPDQKDFLMASLQEKGFLQAITINIYPGREGVILNGVQIVKTCEALAITEIPVHRIYIQPEHEAECHILLNESRGRLSEQQKRTLMKQRFEIFFGENVGILTPQITPYEIIDEGSTHVADYSNLMKVAEEQYQQAEPIKTVRRCVFNLPPEYYDYPEIAVKSFGLKSKSELFIQLLKFCVEDSVNHAA